ncbi:ASTRA complex subunit, partial [Rhizopus stolonifer]
MSNSPSTPDLPPPPEYVFREHKATVNHVHIFDRDQHFASCDAEGWVVVWKMKTRRPISKWKAHKESCLKVTTIENHTLISQGRDNMIHIWKSCLNEPELVSSVVYNALGFCKFSCYSQDNDSTLLCFPSKDDIAMVSAHFMRKKKTKWGKFDIYDLTYQKYVLQNMG